MAPFRKKPTPAEVMQAIVILVTVCDASSFDDPEIKQTQDDFVSTLKKLRQAIIRRTT